MHGVHLRHLPAVRGCADGGAGGEEEVSEVCDGGGEVQTVSAGYTMNGLIMGGGGARGVGKRKGGVAAFGMLYHRWSRRILGFGPFLMVLFWRFVKWLVGWVDYLILLIFWGEGKVRMDGWMDGWAPGALIWILLSLTMFRYLFGFGFGFGYLFGWDGVGFGWQHIAMKTRMGDANDNENENEHKTIEE